ncbi:hypothetical protein QVD17_10025 [Tagetes erecta]|uniref:Uncharacterized protein n=1 Tax=Tagetes erecta TaxID=13708 RepID=A0AAD8L2I9_TARER|nr:hypothetical protein QVD17_10025 [Tagetes erecta]
MNLKQNLVPIEDPERRRLVNSRCILRTCCLDCFSLVILPLTSTTVTKSIGALHCLFSGNAGAFTLRRIAYVSCRREEAITDLMETVMKFEVFVGSMVEDGEDDDNIHTGGGVAGDEGGSGGGSVGGGCEDKEDEEDDNMTCIENKVIAIVVIDHTISFFTNKPSPLSTISFHFLREREREREIKPVSSPIDH